MSRSIPQALFLANVFFAGICGSAMQQVAADPRGTTGGLPMDAARSPPVDLPEAPSLVETGATPTMASPELEAAMKQAQMLLNGDKAPQPTEAPDTPLAKLQNIALAANAIPVHVPASPHLDFSSQEQAATNLLSSLAAQDHAPARSSIVRREADPLPIQREADVSEPTRRVMMAADAATREDMNLGEDTEQGQKVFQEDPKFSPEAIFADKHLNPEVAEFLGHLAQKSRVHRKQVNKAAREAALSQGRAAVRTAGDQDDPSDDIEDMKRAAASLPKKTALSHFFDTIDSKTTAASWLATDCATLSKNISEKYTKMGGRSRTTWATAGPAGNAGRSEVHTGMFFRHWGLGKTDQAARKLRLSVLSFLATQDPAKVKLHIWTDLDKHNNTIKDILGPVAKHPELMDAINITTFDPKAEFAKVGPTLVKEVLAERFKKDSMPHLRSDLYRAVILYNYGGLWMDADTVLMQDVVPLVGEDWAHLVRGKEGAIEGSLISVSKPRSHFANDYLISFVMREPPLEGEVQKPLLLEVFDNDPARTTMHVLPPCFVDSEPAVETAVLGSDTRPGSAFFGSAVPEPYRAFFSMGIQDALKDNSTTDASVLQDASFTQWVQKADSDNDDDKPEESPTSPSWAYHWRGHFGASWARGSLADVAERTFMKRLSIHVPKHH